MISKHFLHSIFLMSLFILSSCSIGYYGDSVGEDVKRYRLLHDYYNELESDYILILENLTISPNDELLIREKAKVEKEMFLTRESLDVAEQQKKIALQNLEKEVVRTQTEVLFNDSLKDDSAARIQKQLKKNGINIKMME